MIYLSVVEQDNPTNRAMSFKGLLEAAGLEGAGFQSIERDESGKPFLQFLPQRHWGYSLSRFRTSNTPSVLMGLCDGKDLGIDAEIWPNMTRDKDFLHSIMAPEDEKAVTRLEGLHRDTGIALWTIKEAALKCYGAVMTDPRHVAITPAREGWWHASPGRLAGAPIPEISIKLMSLWQEQKPNAKILVAIAVVSQNMPQIKMLTPHWLCSALVT
ncbi:MAG: 4'-phosphopantetheinyl transferase superfamily protein [Aestuariivirga sp.]